MSSKTSRERADDFLNSLFNVGSDEKLIEDYLKGMAAREERKFDKLKRRRTDSNSESKRQKQEDLNTEHEKDDISECKHVQIKPFLVLGGWIRYFPNYLSVNPNNYCLNLFCSDCKSERYFVITDLYERSKVSPLIFSYKEVNPRLIDHNVIILECSNYRIKRCTIDVAFKLLKYGRRGEEPYFNQDANDSDQFQHIKGKTFICKPKLMYRASQIESRKNRNPVEVGRTLG